MKLKIIITILVIQFSFNLYCQDNFLKTKFTHFAIKTKKAADIVNSIGFIEFYKDKITFILNKEKQIFSIKSYDLENNLLVLSNMGEIYFIENDDKAQILYEYQDVKSFFYLEKNDFNLVKEFYSSKNVDFNYYDEGKKLIQEKKYSEAFEYLNKAIELNPYSSSAYFFRASSYAGLGEFTRAIKDLDKSIEIDNTKSLFYILRGDCYSKLENDKQAIIDETIAIKLDPKNYLPYKIRGLSNYYLLNYTSAIEDFNFVINYYNNNTSISKDGIVYLYRGLSYFEKKEYEKSCDDANTALKLGVKEADKLYEKCK